MSNVEEICDKYMFDELYEILHGLTYLDRSYDEYYRYREDDVEYSEECQLQIQKIESAFQEKYPTIKTKDFPLYEFEHCLNSKLKQYVLEKFPNITLNKKHFDTYHEYPDFSQSYTYDEIVNTFNAISDFRKLTSCDDPTDSKFYLTQKSYDCMGNILSANIHISADYCEYIYENPENNQYLLRSCVHGALILLDRKIAL